jgi:hypothetical protein
VLWLDATFDAIIYTDSNIITVQVTIATEQSLKENIVPVLRQLRAGTSVS